MEQPYVDVAGLRIGNEYPVRIMGVINLSPESFYKGTVAAKEEDVRRIIARFEREGADIIDIGGASTAPREIYHTREITARDELKRVTNAIDIITSMTKLPLSIDTMSSKVAEKALDMGVTVINDVSGLKADSKMAGLASDRNAPVILMANCRPYCDSIQSSLESLRESLSLARDAGIDTGMILVDPGIGFGKPSNVDYEILHNLGAFAVLGQPILVGVSRKAFIGSLLDQSDPADRLTGSIAATSVAVYNGANIIRTHDVKESRIAVRVGEAIRKSIQTDHGIQSGDLG
ncbi:MAG: dihydropteroate synthase [Candidatus Thorarchaeota archaeon]|nr:dihydropteroate synthase [Candidatus Thorarchaeota archaeon]